MAPELGVEEVVVAREAGQGNPQARIRHYLPLPPALSHHQHHAHRRAGQKKEGETEQQLRGATWEVGACVRVGVVVSGLGRSERGAWGGGGWLVHMYVCVVCVR